MTVERRREGGTIESIKRQKCLDNFALLVASRLTNEKLLAKIKDDFQVVSQLSWFFGHRVYKAELKSSSFRLLSRNVVKNVAIMNLSELLKLIGVVYS